MSRKEIFWNLRIKDAETQTTLHLDEIKNQMKI